MKKILTVILSVCMLMTLAACGSSGTGNSSQVTSGSNEGNNSSSTGTATVADSATTADAANSTNSTSENKTLVVYFSATGNTKNVAQHIKSGLSADIYEIVAAQPYTSDDLNYNNDKSRSTVEMNDKNARPAISGSVSNWSQYDTIYIGYPIWWGEAPRILDTFVETYDFAGKTVIPFCTSASSGLGSSASTLEKLAGTGSWMSGKRFSGSESQDDVINWVNSL